MRQVKLEKVIDIYSLDEMLADPEKKAKLIEFNQPCECEEQAVMDDTSDDIASEIEEYGFKNIHPQWDMSCSQGSGASFSFEDVDIAKLIDNYPDRSLAGELDNARLDGFRETLEYIKDDVIISGKFNSFANHYTHEKTVDVDIDYPDDVNDDTQVGAIVNEVLQTTEFRNYMDYIREVVEKIYYDAAGLLYKKLSDQWEWLHSEEAIIENLKGNGDLEFTADGKCFKPDIYDYPDYTITSVVDDVEYVIINEDGKIWCSVKQSGQPDRGEFRDLSDEPDLGRSKAMIIKGKPIAYTIKKNIEQLPFGTPEVMLAEEAFKIEKEK